MNARPLHISEQHKTAAVVRHQQKASVARALSRPVIRRAASEPSRNAARPSARAQSSRPVIMKAASGPSRNAASIRLPNKVPRYLDLSANCKGVIDEGSVDMGVVQAGAQEAGEGAVQGRTMQRATCAWLLCSAHDIRRQET